MTDSTGYSGTPLIKKLGIKDGYRCLIINDPPQYFDLLGVLPPNADFEDEISGAYEFIHVFITHRQELTDGWDKWKNALKINGTLWVSHPKQTSKIEKDINQNDVRQFGLDGGLVDVKVCAVDTDWSALKFMYRLKDR